MQFWQLWAAIDEYMITGVQQDHHFKSGTYSQVFMQLMSMQAKIDANPKHATMTCVLRVGWATTGRWVLMFSHCIASFIVQCLAWWWQYDYWWQGWFWRSSRLGLVQIFCCTVLSEPFVCSNMIFCAINIIHGFTFLCSLCGFLGNDCTV